MVFSTLSRNRNEITLVGLSLFVILQSAKRLFSILVGNEQWSNDMIHLYQGIQSDVVSGIPLYTSTATANKPPLWEFLHIGTLSAGGKVGGLVAITICNVLISLLIFHILEKRYHYWVGLLASLFFISSLPIINGFRFQPHNFATLFIILALVFSSKVKKGLAVGSAGLMIQYGGVVLPVFIVQMYLSKSDRLSEMYQFIAGVLIMPLISFGVVYLIWGKNAFFGALYWSFLAPIEYARGNPDAHPYHVLGGTGTAPNIFDAQINWIDSLMNVAIPEAHIIIFGVLGITAIIQDDGDYFEWLVSGLAISLLIPLFVRSYVHYWVLPLPFLSVISAIFINRVIGISGGTITNHT